jgi:hypothetical protein
MKVNGLHITRGKKMTTATTTKISHLTAKAILTKAGLGIWYVGLNEYHGRGFRFTDNAFHWDSNGYHNDRQLEITLQLISYLNNAGISYTIGEAQGRWNVTKQAIILTNGGK